MVKSTVAEVLGSLLILTAAGCEEQPRLYSTRAAKGEIILREGFDRAELGERWHATGTGARIENGLLVVDGVRNHPLWLELDLPDDVRIEFDAWASTDEGDLKVELFGDGVSFATSPNYIASGYVVIFGGWNNTLSALVRKNEHGQQRVTSSELKVQPDKRYHFVLTRTGNELHWEVNGAELLVYEDDQPLRGEGQNRFAFSGWETQAHFDNLVIEAL